ncbi:MAG: hypothetical protein P8N61_09500, partial [Porticoccaceae bacterium]|nr:hypothetical protein [Porticoccaceae bacterium]
QLAFNQLVPRSSRGRPTIFLPVIASFSLIYCFFKLQLSQFVALYVGFSLSATKIIFNPKVGKTASLESYILGSAWLFYKLAIAGQVGNEFRSGDWLRECGQKGIFMRQGVVNSKIYIEKNNCANDRRKECA